MLDEGESDDTLPLIMILMALMNLMSSAKRTKMSKIVNRERLMMTLKLEISQQIQ